MSEVYRILSVTLGVPPKATDKFTYEYYDTDNKARSWTGTPVAFYKKYRSEKYAVSRLGHAPVLTFFALSIDLGNRHIAD